jgi:tetratricopeptide (TPR) repeat protein
MKQPTTPEEIQSLHKLFRSDPQRYLRVVNQWIEENPNDSGAHFSRHYVWKSIGEPQRALEDLNKVIALELTPDPISLLARAHLYRHLGEYEKAIEDYDRAEAINPAEWEDGVFGLFFQADTHARLGNESAALARCARLRDDFWTPGFNGAPGGGKSEIAEKLRQVAAAVQRKRL